MKGGKEEKFFNWIAICLFIKKSKNWTIDEIQSWRIVSVNMLKRKRNCSAYIIKNLRKKRKWNSGRERTGRSKLWKKIKDEERRWKI